MAIKVDEKNVHVVALRAGEAKFSDLIARRQKKEDELSEAKVRHLERCRSERSPLELDAEALLNDEPIQAGANVADFGKRQREIDVLSEAIAQHSRLMDGLLRGKYSSEVCNANRDTYVAIEKRIARAVRELAAANEAEILFFRELEAAGCTSITFRPMRVVAVGILSDSQSLATFHRLEVETYLPEAIG